MKPGFYAMPAAEYHADPCPAPSMAAHDAATLLTRTPLHAWAEHPRLNTHWQPDDASSEQDEGTALHALLLEGEDRIEVVAADDWRSKAAKEARAAARADGRIPILAHRHEDLCACADAFHRQIKAHEIGAFTERPGRAEASLFWEDEAEDGPIWCRARADWMEDATGMMVDLKTTAMAAQPDAWFRANKDATIRAAHYLRGARAVWHPRPRYLFLLLERQPPYALSVCELSSAILSMGAEQHQAARNIWAACLKDGDWPGFPPFVSTIEADGGATYRFEDWKLRQQQVRERKGKHFIHQADGAVAEAIRRGETAFG